MAKTYKGEVPQYVRISEVYRKKIKSGEYVYGQKMDGEHIIGEKFNVSRMTGRRVLRDLEKEGLVSRHRGTGTICMWKSAIEVQLYPSCDLMDAIKCPDRKVWLKELSKEVIVDDSAALTMGVDEGKELTQLKQLQMVDKIKVAYIISDILPLNNSRITRTTTKVNTMLPSPEVRSALNLHPDQPVLLKQVFFYDENNEMKQYDQYYYRGDCVFTSSK